MKFILLALSLLSAEEEKVTRLFVGFEPGVDYARRADILNTSGFPEIKNFEEIDVSLIEIESAEPAEAAQKILKHEGVIYVEEDLPIYLTGAGIEYLEPSEDLSWNLQTLNLVSAWKKSKGKGVRVAVLDTGIDKNHPHLKGRVVDCFNTLNPAQNCEDKDDHGTAVAGVIAAASANNTNLGVAPQAHLVAVKIKEANAGSTSNLVDAILWISKKNIQIANMSFLIPCLEWYGLDKKSTDSCPTLQSAINYATEQDILFIASSGNFEQIRLKPAPILLAQEKLSVLTPPCALDNVICVSALNKEKKFYVGSLYGPEVDFIAPGHDVPIVSNNSSILASGTSFSAPHVAGLAALAIGAGISGVDNLNAALKKAAKSIPGIPREKQGHGLIDAKKLVGLAP